MSSPIHHAEDVDPVLIYAPPKARRGMRPAPRYSGDVAMMQLQLQLALDPEAVPEPPSTLRVTRAAWDAASALWPTVLRLGAVAAVAAIAAWGIILLPDAKKWGALLPDPKEWGSVMLAQAPMREPVRQAAQRSVQKSPQRVAQVSRNMQPAEPGTNPVKLVQVDFAAMTPVQSPDKFAAANELPSTEPSAVAALSVPASPSISPPPDNQEIAALVKRGKDFLVNGDFASARLLLNRAAEAGSADGALALGATFDPEVIKRLGATGAVPDIAQARGWYQKAAERGAPGAAEQLAKLTAAQ
jgi:hypothetical protein